MLLLPDVGSRGWDRDERDRNVPGKERAGRMKWHRASSWRSFLLFCTADLRRAELAIFELKILGISGRRWSVSGVTPW